MLTIAHLIAKPWLLEERMASVLYHQYLKGNLAIDKEEAAAKNASIYLSMGGQPIGQYVPSYKIKHASGLNVAVMPVIGTLTKRGDLCSYGMRDYMNEIAALNANEEISAIVLDMEGPGGTVDGTPEFGLAVATSKKPVVTFADCMVASANYWVASQSKHIIANKNNPTELGSIGVLCVHEYWGKFIENNIGEIKIIRAPQSIDKAKQNVVEPLEPEQEAEIIQDLKVLAIQFHKMVKKGRGSALKATEKEWGTGKMFKAHEALELGLVDAIGTMADAIAKAAELGAGRNGRTTSSNSANNKPSNMKNPIKAVSSFLNRKKAAEESPAADEPAAMEDDMTPRWTEDMIFNTDGSGDGAFCIHADTEGNDRKFETKIDNNQGNEPPVDPGVTENDAWAQVVEEAAEEPAEAPVEQEEPAAARIAKLNVALKKAQDETKKAKAEAASLKSEVAQLKAEKTANEKKLAAPATTVVSENDNHDDEPERELTAEEKEAAAYIKASKTNLFKKQ